MEASAGVILPDDYIKKISTAAHEVGALMVLDCIASGCVWIDMDDCGVDVLISAPQKGWSASPSAGLVMLSSRAVDQIEKTKLGKKSKIDGSKVHVGPSEAMSKSKKNIVDPESMIKIFGADAVRWFILSDSPPERDVQWSTEGVSAANKFIRIVKG
mgnify:CR=1 FL=1